MPAVPHSGLRTIEWIDGPQGPCQAESSSGRRLQRSASNGVHSSPWTSATARFTTQLPTTFEPRRRAGLPCTTVFESLEATRRAYGIVALVRANVDVRGTAPGTALVDSRINHHRTGSHLLDRLLLEEPGGSWKPVTGRPPKTSFGSHIGPVAGKETPGNPTS